MAPGVERHVRGVRMLFAALRCTAQALQKGIRLRQLYQNHSKKVVLLNADGLLPFRNVVHVINVCRSTGARVFLVTPAT